MKQILITLLIYLIPLNSYYKEEKKDKYNEQWNTVLQLQRIIDNNILIEAPNLFSRRVRDKIIITIEKNPDFFKKAWRLNTFQIKNYKEKVFKGEGLFIFEDNEWKIDEI